MDEALAESQCDDVKGEVANSGLSVQEGLQHLLQVNLHDRAAHARRDVTHFFEILLLGLFFPWMAHAHAHTQSVSNVNTMFLHRFQVAFSRLTFTVGLLHSRVFLLQVCL